MFTHSSIGVVFTLQTSCHAPKRTHNHAFTSLQWHDATLCCGHTAATSNNLRELLQVSIASVFRSQFTPTVCHQHKCNEDFFNRHLLWYAVSGEDDRAQGASTLARNPHIQPWSQLEGTTLSAHCAIDVPYSATAAGAPLCKMVVQDVLVMLPCHYSNQHLTKVDSRQRWSKQSCMMADVEATT